MKKGSLWLFLAFTKRKTREKELKKNLFTAIKITSTSSIQSFTIDNLKISLCFFVKYSRYIFNLMNLSKAQTFCVCI